MTDPKNIRLKLPGELFWATQYDDLPANQAEVNNHLLSDQCSFGDRVEFDEDRNVVRVVMTRAQVTAELAAFGTSRRCHSLIVRKVVTLPSVAD